MAQLKVGFPLYESFDSLDVLGPFQTFTWAGMDRYLLGPTPVPVTSFEGVALTPRKTFGDCCKEKLQLDMLFVPGGADTVSVLQQGHPGNNPYLDFLAAQAPGCTLVCTGSLLLADISSGLNEALYIVSLLYGTDQARRGQLAMQYHPQPIFHAGDHADSDIKDDPGMVEDRIREFQIPQTALAVKEWLAAG